jgi:hypothetical protein
MSGKCISVKLSGVGLGSAPPQKPEESSPNLSGQSVANEKHREERNEDRQRVQCYCRDSKRECGRDEAYATNVSVNIRLRSATQPKWRGAKDVEPNRRSMMAINRGMAMIERVTNICHRTNFALISFMPASPSEKARLAVMMAETASLTLSPKDELDVLG